MILNAVAMYSRTVRTMITQKLYRMHSVESDLERQAALDLFESNATTAYFD
jgi:hypothetical protein